MFFLCKAQKKNLIKEAGKNMIILNPQFDGEWEDPEEDGESMMTLAEMDEFLSKTKDDIDDQIIFILSEVKSLDADSLDVIQNIIDSKGYDSDDIVDRLQDYYDVFGVVDPNSLESTISGKLFGKFASKFNVSKVEAEALSLNMAGLLDVLSQDE